MNKQVKLRLQEPGKKRVKKGFFESSHLFENKGYNLWHIDNLPDTMLSSFPPMASATNHHKTMA